jgi:hypothetical protein
MWINIAMNTFAMLIPLMRLLGTKAVSSIIIVLWFGPN